ncbi:MAG: hypothetical protein P8173_15855 [Gammaproteobacteria bacterium]|jgi:hypothetical protein
MFASRYSYFTQNPDSDQIPVEVVFQRNGDRVSGWYSFGLGIGRIIDGTRLYFDWEWADSDGRGLLEASDSRSFRGTWGYREARQGAGVWRGERLTVRGQAPGQIITMLGV